MSANHTTGRLNFHNNNWQVSTVYSADGKMVAQCLIDEKTTEETQFNFEQIKEANARRIVACWNACAGLDTELLENSVAFGVTVNDRFDSKRTELRQFHIDVAALRAENEQLREEVAATVAALEFAMKTDCHDAFIKLWLHGQFDELRKEWPEAPESIYAGQMKGREA